MMQLFDLPIWKGTVINPLDELLRRRGSLYSHGSIYVGPMKIQHPKTGEWIEGDQIEATIGGVQLSWMSRYQYRDCKILRYVDPIPPSDQSHMLERLKRKIGDPYEYKSFLGYLGIPIADDPNQEVCVELCAELYTEQGFQVWGVETPDNIYPRDLLINPKFFLVEERKGISKPVVQGINPYQVDANV